MERQEASFEKIKHNHEFYRGKAESNETSCMLLFAETVLAIASCTLIIGLFTLPIAFHFTDSTEPTNLTLLQEKLFVLQLNSSINQSQPIISNNTESCESELLAESWANASITDTCSITEMYSGSICKPYLQVWKSCVSTDSNESNNLSLLPMSTSQIDREAILMTLSGYLNSFPDCQPEALPFLCQYSFPLIDCSTGIAYQSSMEECQRISQQTCATLWNLAVALGFQDSLPVCSVLPRANSYPSTASNTTNNQSNVTTELICEEDFTVINATCQPRCDGFFQNSDPATLFVLISELLAAALVIIVSVLIGIFFIKNGSTMSSYPSFLIIFMATNMLLQAILVVISAIDRAKLLCSSLSVIESLDEPTAFTLISGVLYHYLLINLVLWWFFHVLIYATSLLFPQRSRVIINKGLHRYTSLFVILLCLLSPLGGVAFAFASRAYGYRLQRLPPGLPTTSSGLWFYSIIFLYCIALAGGICMLALSAWIALKNSFTNKSFTKRVSRKDWSLLIYFTFSAIYLITYVIYSSLWTINYNRLTTSLTEYFLCEALGHTPDKCSRDEFEKYSYPYLEGFTALCRVLVQLSILIFAINNRGLDAKQNDCCAPSPNKVNGRNLSVVNPAYI